MAWGIAKFLGYKEEADEKYPSICHHDNVVMIAYTLT
jgi:hypothetical protein